MTWNYRVIKHDLRKPAYFAIHEVYYNEAGKITNWTTEPIDIVADSRKEILATLHQMETDCKSPTLSEAELLKIRRRESRIELVLTCSACPEQYDALLDGRQVGYLRLRHGHFTVDYPDVGGETIYEGRPEGDGAFTESERDQYIGRAIGAIEKRLIQDEKNRH